MNSCDAGRVGDVARGNGHAAMRASGLGPQELSELRRHTVNMTAGRFSTDGEFQTGPEDVDAIFGEHLPEWWREYGGGGPLRIVLFAHGGLVSEGAGLRIVHKHLKWWKANRVYPLYFAWETGFWESVRQLMQGATREAQRELTMARGALSDVADRAIEGIVRTLGGGLVWSGMKRSAELAFADDGAGRVVMDGLKAFRDGWNDSPLEVHAVGHSAGSIFLAEGLPYALEQGIAPIKTLHLLAPAVTVPRFKKTLLPRIGKEDGNSRGIDHLTLFTMARHYELADTVSVYRKSLLYLIHYALEPERGTEILGLETSLRRDKKTSKLLGLGTHGRSDSGEVVWSVTDKGEGRSASRSTTHGGFDDDPATMHSVLRRIRGLNDEQSLVRFTPVGERAARELVLDELPAGGGAVEAGAAAVLTRALLSNPNGPAAPADGRRRALCIGIDTYPEAPLSGCASDAQLWSRWFAGQGFATEPPLLNRDATRDALLGAMRRVIEGSRPGDVIAIQYSGHGTQLPDLDGDEADGDTPGFDEALVPVDHRRSGYFIDDDLAEICDAIPPDVNVTFLMDCCHSGTNTRLFVGHIAPPSGEARKRFLPPDAEMVEVHKATRRGQAGRRAYRPRGDVRREILFSACRSDQVAWESHGQGDFTRHAMKVLSGGTAGLTHARFHERVNAAFGLRPRQNPELWCDDRFRQSPLLSAVATAAPTTNGRDLRGYAPVLRELVECLEG